MKERVHVITRPVPAACRAVQAATLPRDSRRLARSARGADEVQLVGQSQLWLTQFDRGELTGEEVEASLVNDYEAKIAALERKVGQLTMELDLLKKTPPLRLVSNSEKCSIISGPKAAPSDGGAK